MLTDESIRKMNISKDNNSHIKHDLIGYTKVGSNAVRNQAR